jgi:YidC/Oxa1 family membrane protein insertase
MSQPQNPRGNFIQTLLFMAVVFMGINLFIIQPRQQAADAPPYTEILAKMREHNQAIRDQSILTGRPEAWGDLNSFKNAIRKELDAGKLTREQHDRLRVEATVLAADTSYKAGLTRREFHRVNMAHITLNGLKKEFVNTPLWNEPVPVSFHPWHATFQRTQVSAAQLYGDINRGMTELGRQTMVWGFFPGFQLIDGLVAVSGRNPGFSYALAALILAIIVRIIVWPLTQKQLMFGRQMMQLQPLSKELQEKYEGQELQMKLMALYKEYGINPAAGCFPMLLQMPLFILIYQSMLHYRYEFTKGTFLWVNPQVGQVGGLVAPNLGERDSLLIGIYGISMIVTTMLTPASDPTQIKKMRILGVSMAVFFTFLMFLDIFPVPAAFVLYWIFTNILATIQSLRAYRMEAPPLVKVQTATGGKVASNGSFNGQVNDQMKKRTGAPKVHKPKKRK